MMSGSQGGKRSNLTSSRGALHYFIVTLLGSILTIALYFISPDLGPLEQTRPVYPQSVLPIRVHYVNRPPWIGMDIFSKCDKKCYLTAGGGNAYSDSKVVVFHTPYVNEKHVPKKMGQIWVFHSLEPPWLHWSKFNNWKREFNWTMSYRRDSDILYVYSIFKTKKMKQSTLETSHLSEKWQNKTGNIAWMVSHCGTPSKRDDYVKIFKKNITVDIYGKCGSKQCPRDTSNPSKCLESYKFYLAFENQICLDYITEKSFKIYSSAWGPIPITRGGSNYSMYLPPGSYVDASKFKQISHLKAYIDSLSRNTTRVKEYMNWGKYYEVEFDHAYPFCQLCRRLHLKDQEKYKRLYEDIGEWHRGDKSGRKSCIVPNDLI